MPAPSGAVRPARLSTDPEPLRLWHYTCDDAAPLIDEEGLLRPNGHPWLPDRLVWLTDLEPDAVPNLDLALGLRGAHSTCDRTAHRYEVLDPAPAVRWTTYVRGLVREGRIRREVREALDYTPGGYPAHWFVSLAPIAVRRA